MVVTLRDVFVKCQWTEVADTYQSEELLLHLSLVVVVEKVADQVNSYWKWADCQEIHRLIERLMVLL